MEYKIEKDITAPEPHKRFPLSELEVGESFTIALKDRNSVQSHASKVKSLTGKVFMVRKVDEQTCRVWRTK